MSATMTATATVTAVAGAEDATERIPSVPMSRGLGAEDAAERTPSVPMSRGLKIEDLAAAPGGAGDQAEASQLFSVDALVHAVSGSVGGNVAMLGALRCPLAARARGASPSACAGACACSLARRCFRLTAVLARRCFRLAAQTQRSTRWTSS